MANSSGNVDGEFWGSRTATIDWCESNYEISEYVAEFWNTISNLIMIVLPMYGIYWCVKQISHSKNRPNHANNRRPFTVPTTVIWCYVGVMLVGVGSWMFHMTLLYPMQLLDEIPMMFGSAILLYANYELILAVFELERQHKRTLSIKNLKPDSRFSRLFRNKKLVLSVIITYCVVCSYAYVKIWTNPLFHENTFGVMVFLILFQNFYLIYKYKLRKRMYAISVGYYLLGFLLWNLDNHFCDYLQMYRKSVETFFGVNTTETGEPANDWKSILLNSLVVTFKSISEFHSLWHILTGYASFITVLHITDIHYQRYLLSENSLTIDKQTLYSTKRPVTAKFCHLFYHLNDNLTLVNNENEKPLVNKQPPKISKISKNK